MQGRRVPDGEFKCFEQQPGDYGKTKLEAYDGVVFDTWWVCCPGGQYGRLCMPEDVTAGKHPSHHIVEEHEDGAITVSPQPTGNGQNSIKVRGFDGNAITEWHGYIEHGVWRSV